MENMNVARRAPRKRRQKTSASIDFLPSCRCGLPVPSPLDWYCVRFSDRAELLIAKDPPWKQGYCPVLFLDRLVREFDLDFDGDVILAPFPFCAPDRYDARRFLNLVLCLSVPGYDPDNIPMGGSC